MSFLAILKSLGSLKAILDYVAQFVKWLSDTIKKMSVAKKNKAIEKKAEELKKAEGVNAKTELACDLEKMANPDSDCK